MISGHEEDAEKVFGITQTDLMLISAIVTRESTDLNMRFILTRVKLKKVEFRSLR